MKIIYAVLITCFVWSNTCAQEIETVSLGNKLKVTKINFSIGNDMDMIYNLDHSYFIDQIPNDRFSDLKDLNFNGQDMVGGTCENPHFRFGLSLEHPSFKNFELRTNLVYMPNRVDAVTYENRFTDFTRGEYINFHTTHDELALEASLLYRLKVIGPLNLYGGVGTNIGASYNNDLCISGSSNLLADNINPGNADNFIDDNIESFYMEECFDPGISTNQRIFLEGGLGVSFDWTNIKFLEKLEFNLIIRRGVGFRVHPNNLQGTHLISASSGLSYRF